MEEKIELEMECCEGTTDTIAGEQEEDVMTDSQNTESEPDNNSSGSDAETVNEEEQLEKAKKSLFSKKEKKEKKDKRDEKIEELTDRLMRQMAEFDNFRKRTEREKSQMFEIGARDILEKMLPIVDNFERGFSGLSEEEMQNPFAQGMDKVYKQMLTAFESIGVKPIEAVGKEFDPNFHNAVMHVEDEEFGENVVAEEFQKGYLYRDTVIRHSMVKVAN